MGIISYKDYLNEDKSKVYGGSVLKKYNENLAKQNLNKKKNEYDEAVNKNLQNIKDLNLDYSLKPFSTGTDKTLKNNNNYLPTAENRLKAKQNQEIINNSQEVQNSREAVNKASNELRLAQYQYDLAKEENHTPTLWDKTIGVPIRATKDLLSMFSLTSNPSAKLYKDESGNKSFLPTANELRQQNVSNSYDTKVGKLVSDIVYNGTKILGSSAIPGGSIVYWGDMFNDSYVNTINDGYHGNEALLYATLSTTSELVTEKLMGGLSKLVPGGNSNLSKTINKTLSKVMKNDRLRSILSNALSEGSEEFVQEYVDLLNRNLVLGENNKFDLKTFENALYSGLVGMGTGGLSGAVNVDVNTKNTGIIPQINKNGVIDVETYVKQLQEAKKTEINQSQTNIANETLTQSLPVKNLNFVESARKYNIDSNSETIRSIDNLLNKRNINAMFDESRFSNIKTNAFWTIDENGNRNVIFNPNANTKDLLQNVAIHELTHDLLSSKNSAETLNSKEILDFISTKEGYIEARNSLIEDYSKVYDPNSTEFQNIIDEEVVASVLGNKLGTQEFVNQLVYEKPTVAKRVLNWIENRINDLKKLVGYTSEKTFWEDVKKRFEKAYKMSYNNTTNQADTRYATVKNNPYGHVKEFVKLEQSIQKDAHIVISPLASKFAGIEESYSVTDINGYTYDFDIFENGNYRVSKVELLKDKVKEKVDGQYSKQDSRDFVSSSKYEQGYNGFDNQSNRNIGTSTENVNLPAREQTNTQNGLSNQTQNGNNRELDSSSFSFKQKQLDIILENNQMLDDYHTGIRTIDDIKTFDEVVDDDESFVWGDFSQEDAKKALEKGSITIYSSYPIENGVFVSTSRNQARDYAGNNKIYSKEVTLNEVAWINGDEGQYAKVQDEANQSSKQVDNQGRTLTKEQQEFFKDSAIRVIEGKYGMPNINYKGNLFEVYHGTNNGEFNVFNNDYIGSSNDMGWYGEGFYFAFTKGEAKTYGNNVISAYLNIKNPFNFTDEMQMFNGEYTNNTSEDFAAFMINLKNKFPEIANNETIKVAGWEYNDDGSRDIKRITLSELAKNIEDVYNSSKLRIIEINDSGQTKYQYAFGDDFRNTEMPDDIRQLITENGISNENDIEFAIENPKFYPKLTEDKINKLRDFYKETEYNFALKTIGYPNSDKGMLEKGRLGYAKQVVEDITYSYIDIHMPEVYMQNFGNDITQLLKQKGYDGVIQSSSGDEIVAFYPNQIKRVDNTSPTSNEDIRYSQKSNSWSDFVNKNFKSDGTGQTLQQVKLPTRKDISSVENNTNESKVLNPLEISKLRPKDANTTPTLPDRTYNKNNDGNSHFFENIRTKTNMLNENQKNVILNEDDVKYYDKITNKVTLEKAFDRLNENGAIETNNWFAKDSEKATAIDVAEGWILLKQYADKNNADGMVAVAKKMRDMGTKAGQTVQAFNIMERMSPEGMVKYAQSELSEAYDKMVKNKSREWIEKYRDDFDLKPEEVSFIMKTMEEVQQMEDGYEKRVKLAEIQKVMTDKLPPERGAGIKAWMRISMLFNPKTQVRNVMGNAVIAPVNYFSDLFSGIVDKAISKKTGVRTIGKTDLKSYAKGFKTGLYQSYNDFKKGINTRDINGNRFEIGQGKSFNDNTKLGKSLNKVDSLLSFMLDAGDRGFYEASFTNSINNQLVLNNTTELTQEMIDIATQEALSRTWQDNNGYTKFVLQTRNALNKINVKGYGLGDVLIPFAKTPANLTKAIVDYSPAGLVKTIIDGNNLKKSLSNGQYNAQLQHQFVQELGKATAGTMLYVLGYALAKAGVVSGESDDDKDTRDFMKNTLGVSSYSIKIGNKSFTYDWAQPISAPLSIMANYVRKSEKNKDASKLENLISSLDVAGNILLQQSFMESINTVLSNNDGLATGIQEAIMELPSRAIPTLMKQIVDLTDSTQRQTFEYDQPLKTAINKVKAKVPIFSKTLSPSVDTMGREIQKYGGKNNIFNVLINPANVNTENISDSAKEIYRLYKSTGETNIMPRVAPYYINQSGEKITLNATQRTEYQKISGSIIETSIADLLKNTKYKNMDDTEKAEVINKIVNYSYNKAREDILDISMSNEYNKINMYIADGGKVSDYYLNKEEVDYSYSYPEKYKTIKQITTYDKYLDYQDKIDNVKDNYDNTNQRKTAVINYVNSLKLSIPQKAMLIKLNYSSYDTYNKQIIEYIVNQKLTATEKSEILTKLGFTVKDGRVYY